MPTLLGLTEMAKPNSRDQTFIRVERNLLASLLVGLKREVVPGPV